MHLGCARKRTGSVAPALRPLMGSLGSYWVKAKATRLPWCTPALAEAECQLSIDPHEDGSGIMRDAQTAKPQTFPDRRRLVRLQSGRQHGPDPGLSSQLHPTSHPCRTPKPPYTTERDGPTTRARRTPGPSLPSGSGGDKPAGPGEGVSHADERHQRPPTRGI